MNSSPIVSGPASVILYVDDLEVTGGFYERYLGWRQSKLGNPIARFYDTTTIPVVLIDASTREGRYDGERCGWNVHLNLQVATETILRELRDDMQRDGVEVTEIFDSSFGLAFHFKDPEGNYLSLFESE